MPFYGLLHSMSSPLNQTDDLQHRREQDASSGASMPPTGINTTTALRQRRQVGYSRIRSVFGDFRDSSPACTAVSRVETHEGAPGNIGRLEGGNSTSNTNTTRESSFGSSQAATEYEAETSNAESEGAFTDDMTIVQPWGDQLAEWIDNGDLAPANRAQLKLYSTLVSLLRSDDLFSQLMQSALIEVFPNHSNTNLHDLISGFESVRFSAYGFEVRAHFTPIFTAQDFDIVKTTHQIAVPSISPRRLMFGLSINTHDDQPRLIVSLSSRRGSLRAYTFGDSLIGELKKDARFSSSGDGFARRLLEYVASDNFQTNLMSALTAVFPSTKFADPSDLVVKCPIKEVSSGLGDDIPSFSIKLTPKFPLFSGPKPVNHRYRYRTNGMTFDLNLHTKHCRHPRLEISVFENSCLLVCRGKEFATLSSTLRKVPAFDIGLLEHFAHDRAEGAVNAGAPSRELITNAYCQGLDQVTRSRAEQEGNGTIPFDIDTGQLECRAVKLAGFGRLLAYVADDPRVNVPSTLPEHALGTVVTLAANINTPVFNINHLDDSWINTINTALVTCPSLVSQLAKATLKEKIFDHYQDALEHFCSSSNHTSNLDASKQEEFSDRMDELQHHLVSALGIEMKSDRSGFCLAKGNLKLPQLMLMAQGFSEVKEARIARYGSRYPASIDQYSVELHGTGDVRRSLVDPKYERSFRTMSSDNSFGADDQRDFAELVRQWAGDATDKVLSEICRSVTGSDALPDFFSNRANGTHQFVFNIREDLDDITFFIEACTGRVNIHTYPAREVVQAYRENPNKLPDLFVSLFQAIAADCNQFNEK